MAPVGSSFGYARMTSERSMARAAAERPKQRREPGSLPFDTIALLLQGGGALGAYEGGVYQALAEANVLPSWVAGISIGAINAAVIAGNPPETRVARLREFWEAVSNPPLGAFGVPYNPAIEIKDAGTHRLVNQTRAFFTTIFGAPYFFAPRFPPSEFLPSQTPDQLSFYDTTPLKATLERLVDFDRINHGDTRLSVGAVNVRTGNFTSFDTTTQKIDVRHVIASGSLPPGFPATEIDGEFYWDGGVVSNSILQYVLDSLPRRDTLAFQVDVWSASGESPRDLAQTDTREKDIRYSSRTRAATDQFRYAQRLRHALRLALERLPTTLRESPEFKVIANEADETVHNVVHLIYHTKSYEGVAKDYEFSRRTMEEHWRSGHEDASRALAHPEIFQRPDTIDGFRAFDFSEPHSSEDES
jgi:NTE family protein